MLLKKSTLGRSQSACNHPYFTTFFPFTIYTPAGKRLKSAVVPTLTPLRLNTLYTAVRCCVTSLMAVSSVAHKRNRGLADVRRVQTKEGYFWSIAFPHAGVLAIVDHRQNLIAIGRDFKIPLLNLEHHLRYLFPVGSNKVEKVTPWNIEMLIFQHICDPYNSPHSTHAISTPSHSTLVAMRSHLIRMNLGNPKRFSSHLLLRRSPTAFKKGRLTFALLYGMPRSMPYVLLSR